MQSEETATLDALLLQASRIAAGINGGGGHVQTVAFQPAPPQRTERLVLVMCVATAVMGVIAGGATVAAILQGQRITDMRADHARQIDRIDRRLSAHAGWALTESNTTRGYIWTGKVPVANPYPKEAEP